MKGNIEKMMLDSPAGLANLKATTPCAACKLLRRRCTQDCSFSPYFSPNEPQNFVSVHKVFGASNVSKMLKEVPEAQRRDTANSLIIEATVRLRDPVNGCMGVISALQQQIQLLHTELIAVQVEILKFKLRKEANNLASISSDLISNNYISLYSSTTDKFTSLAPPPQSQPQHSIPVFTSAAHRIDPTSMASTPSFYH